MLGIFDIDNRLFRAISKLLNIILLNVLWLICSIPILTIGAATTAVYYVALKMVKDEDGYIIKDFFKAFLQNFKQGTLFELIFVLFGLVLYGDIRYFLLNESFFSYFFIGLFALLSILLAVILDGFYTSVLIMVISPILAVAGYAYVGSILFRKIFENYELR